MSSIATHDFATPSRDQKVNFAPHGREAREEAFSPLFHELKRQGRTQTWLARQLGVSIRMVNHYAHGENRMPDHLLTKACELIGFTRSWLEAQSPLLLTDPQRIVFEPKERRAS